VLRIALVQALRFGTPPHAAIATALPLLEGGPRRLVHGVLSTILREGWSLPDPPTLPEAAADRWRRAWGDDAIAKAARLIAAPPPIDITFPESAPPPGIEGTSLLPGHLRLEVGAGVPGLTNASEGSTGDPAVARPAAGRWWVQDLAASLPARLLGRGDGRSALDLCAAPGGKTMQLAAAGWNVTAVDVSEKRLRRLSENLDRTGLDAQIIVADLMKWTPAEKVDAILLDAPCSATGIFRRHPDVLHRVSGASIAKLAEDQTRMLTRAANWLNPQGKIVYSVCSLEPEEGEQVAARFLAARPDFIEEERRRLLPGEYLEAGGADSFFMARFARA
jgi:16S rRNA (cytosine967-C5)-methyltransferase